VAPAYFKDGNGKWGVPYETKTEKPHEADSGNTKNTVTERGA